MTSVRRWWAAGLVGLLAGCAGSSSPAKPEAGEDDRMPPPYRGPVRAPLIPGEDFPDLRVKGWLNGEPKPVTRDGPKAHVFDVWSAWGPHCKTFGPALVALRDKYAPRGVQFVSVTDLPRSWAESSGREIGIAWPSGYGLAHHVLGELGAITSGGMLATPGHAVSPTIFVVGPDGKVRGTDERGRLTRPDAPETVQQLEALIEKTLAEGAAPKAP